MSINPFDDITARLDRLEELIQRRFDQIPIQQHSSPEQINGNRIMTIDEAAKFLKMSKGSIYQLVHLKSIPFSRAKGMNGRPGKRLYFHQDRLIEWIQAGTNQTISEIRRDARRSRNENKSD